MAYTDPTVIGIIYKITNKINGKVYIGQTIKSLTRRWQAHIADSTRNSSYALHRAIRKYEPASFTVEQIDSASSYQKLCKKEVFWISFYKSLSLGYNMTLGGEGRYGAHVSIETRRKISESNKGKIVSEETKKRMSIAMTGVKHKASSKESIEKRARQLRGRTLSHEHVAKVAKANRKPIVCLNTGIIYESSTEAVKELGINFGHLSEVLHGHRTHTKNLVFIFEKEVV